MDSAPDRYLHKKFKKQQSLVDRIEPRLQDKENQKNIASRNVEVQSEPQDHHNHHYRQNYYHIVNSDRDLSCFGGIVPIAAAAANHRAGGPNLSFVPVVVHPQNAYKSSISNSVVSLEKGDVRTLDYRNSFVNDACADTDGQFENISFVISDRTEAPAQVCDVDNVQIEPATISSSILHNYYPNGKAVKHDQNSDHISEDVDAKTDKKEESSLPDKTAGGKYVCTYCNLVCSKPSVLQKHIRAHTNERPFPCTSCGFSFKTRSNLYKHCRSRTHANRVMGNKAQEISNEIDGDSQSYVGEKSPIREDHKEEEKKPQDVKQKPYKPRFKGVFETLIKENNENKHQEAKQTNSDYLSSHINELIHKNNSIVNSNDSCLIKKRVGDNYDNINNNDYVSRLHETYSSINEQKYDEPLNLTNKNRKRCLSEVTEPTVQKSLIKELLLKNLYADTNKQCQYCKMIFQTVTELDLHKLRSCKGFTKTGARYSRSSSVNVASILTQNKNAFDTNPHVPNTVFPLKSPGPCLGKTRLVESDKAKSFSFEDGMQTNFQALQTPGEVLKTSQRYSLSPLTLHDKIKRTPVKLFGGEVKITQTTGESKFFRIDSQEDKYNRDANYPEYSCKLSENRVVKSTLQSGGTVLQNKPTYSKQDRGNSPDVIRVYDNASVSPNINLDRNIFDVSNAKDRNDVPMDVTTSIIDFSQKAVKLFAPNLKQPSLVIPGISAANKHAPLLIETKFNHLKRPIDDGRSKDDLEKRNFDNANFAKFHPEPVSPKLNSNFYDPMKLVVGGKVFRHVPGIPGPIVANTMDMGYPPVVSKNCARLQKPNIRITRVDSPKFAENVQAKVPERRSPKFSDVKSESRHDEVKAAELKSPKLCDVKSPAVKSPEAPRKFARPNSLALKPSMSVLKQHHGLTPTMFNQILISPDTPRVAKKYNHQILHGNYFSYLGLKSSTKSVYCTLNKTQPFYVPHFKKLSMYSEWRQQDNKSDKLYVSAYDCRQRQQKYTMSGKVAADLIVHSSYKFTYTEVPAIREEPTKSILGGYESNEDYTYVRGRGRGRYVCDQCGIRCKKPSMLKKHIRTHSNDRPYTCSHCNFSFKTKGNLTKHMKSKAHTKNSAANSSSSNSSTQQSGTPSSESDTDDSGMDSSDESTRQQEHEAAYGLLSLSQKPNVSQTDCYSQSPIASTTSNPSNVVSPERNFMDTEQIAHVSKSNYAKNKILDQQSGINFSPSKLSEFIMHVDGESQEKQKIAEFLGRTSATRPLTYPYTSVLLPEIKPSEIVDVQSNSNDSASQDKVENIKQFNVIKRYGRFQTGYEIQPPPKTVEIPEYKLDSPKYEKYESNKLEELRPAAIVVADSPQNVASDLRKRKGSPSQVFAPKIQKNDTEVIDLSMTSNVEKTYVADVLQNGEKMDYGAELPRNNIIDAKKNKEMINYRMKTYEQKEKSKAYYNNVNECYRQEDSKDNEDVYKKSDVQMLNEENNRLSYLMHEQQQQQPNVSELSQKFKQTEYDNSAMETLADIATKQVKLEKNSVAKNVASQLLKLATKNEYQNDGLRDSNSYISNNKDVNEMMVKPEENKNCTICSKSFSKPSQLRLHMNIHYLERPFRCDSCSVSFRTKGHLQKHERSASHHNKLSSSPTLSSQEPRPFKCSDCNIAFRIHGHLAKHLRSKMHIMKLECLAKIPFGLYAELERSNSLLTEINTTDGDQCLESLKMLAKKVFLNDPNKLNQLGPSTTECIDADS